MGGRGNAASRGSSKFDATNASGGGAGGVEGYGAAEKALARKLFGKNMTAAQIATMAGADAFKGKSASVEIGIKNGKLQVDIAHRFISTRDGMTRTFFKDAKGKLTIENEAFFLKGAAQGKGVGTASFASQVQAAKDNGVKNITTYALRNDARKNASIGHIAWGNLGYNAPLSTAVQRAWTGRNPLAQFNGVKTPRTVRELYNTKGGKQLWAEKGEGGRMIFSLTRGSVSIRALNGYLKGKGKPRIK